ncbi:MAG: hypothetical protein HZB67_05040 [Candidatus Aenigmarchaeota archaeon]|nr:hypothetical protein [Candidatus Aenigmarchaeota archaeon]
MLSKKAVFTGAQIAYSVICPTKLWYFTNNIRLEKELFEGERDRKSFR